MTTIRDIDLARVRTSYLLRGLWKRVDWSGIQQSRRSRLPAELSEQVYPIAVSERSTLGWIRAVANRFDMSLTANDVSRYPASVIIPKMFVDEGTVTEPDSTLRDGDVRVRWDVFAQQIAFDALRLMLHDGAPMVATFATTEPAHDEHTMFPVACADGAGATPLWEPTRPKSLITPRLLRTVWTVISPLHHGHDEKTGNVSLFRRHRVIDPTTGSVHLVPFISGNAVRGQWRDLVFGRLLELVGMSFAEVPPRRAHSLLAGGTIAVGADTAKIDVPRRRRAREICPAWDLLGGTLDEQLMGGVASVWDPVLVCRETAWMLHHELAPEMRLEDFRASLKSADELTQLRLMTRHAHRDIPESDGSQMLLNVESLLPGAHLFHGFAIHGIDGVSRMTKACMADLAEQFAKRGAIGAKFASGHGAIACGEYVPRDDASALPPASEYVAWVTEHADEIRAWLVGDKAEPEAAPEPKAKRARRTNGKASTESAASDEGF